MNKESSIIKQTVPVWDLLIRVFHWSLVCFFTFWYLSGGEVQWHYWSGYAISGLISFRVFWGIFGTKHARFVDFIRSPSTVKSYLLSLRDRTSKRHLGHNPAGAVMIVILLLGMAFMAFTGMLLAGFGGNGPLANSALLALEFLPIKALHEIAANLLVAAIFFHLLGVILSSWMHKENLVKAMVTGQKRVEGDLHE